MKSLLNNPWVVAVLCAAATYFVVQSFFDWNEQTRRAARPAMVVEPDSGDERNEAAIADPGSIDEALARLAIPENPPDPFGSAPMESSAVAPSVPPATVETLHLTAIWEQGPALLLLVNDHVRQVGDHIGPILIESATLEGVWLSHVESRDFLPFGGVFSLVTPASQSGVNNPNDDEF